MSRHATVKRAKILRCCNRYRPHIGWISAKHYDFFDWSIEGGKYSNTAIRRTVKLAQQIRSSRR